MLTALLSFLHRPVSPAPARSSAPRLLERRGVSGKSGCRADLVVQAGISPSHSRSTGRGSRGLCGTATRGRSTSASTTIASSHGYDACSPSAAWIRRVACSSGRRREACITRWIASSALASRHPQRSAQQKLSLARQDFRVGAATPECSSTDRVERDAWLSSQGWAGRQLIMVQPGNHRSMLSRRRERWRRLSADDKAWPTERWVTLLHKVHARMPNALIVLRGSHEETQMLGRIQAATGLDSVVVAGVGLRQLFALCEGVS